MDSFHSFQVGPLLAESTMASPFDLQSPTMASGSASLAAFSSLSHDISSSVASILLSTTSAAIHPHLFQAWSFPSSPRSVSCGTFAPEDAAHAAPMSPKGDAPPCRSVPGGGVGCGEFDGDSGHAEGEQLPALMAVSWGGGQQSGDAQVLKQPAQRSISPTRERRKAASSGSSPNRMLSSPDCSAPSTHAIPPLRSTGQQGRCDEQTDASSAIKPPPCNPSNGHARASRVSPSGAFRTADSHHSTHPPPLMSPGVPNLFSAKPPRPPRQSSKADTKGLRSGLLGRVLRSGDSRKPSAGGADRLGSLMGGRRKASGEPAVMMPMIILLLVLFLVLTVVQGVLSTEQAKRILADPSPAAQQVTGMTWHDLVGQWNGSSETTNTSSLNADEVSGSFHSSMNRKLGGSPPYATSGTSESMGHSPQHTLGQQAQRSAAQMVELGKLKHMVTWQLRRLLR